MHTVMVSTTSQRHPHNNMKQDSDGIWVFFEQLYIIVLIQLFTIHEILAHLNEKDAMLIL